MHEMPMKSNVLLYTFLVLILLSFSGFAQQKNTNLDSVPKAGLFFQNPVNRDTSIVPVLIDAPSFYNYNFAYKKRLDSIQKAVPMDYNEYVQKYIDVYSSRKDMIGKMLGLSSYYFPIFEQALKAYHIPDEIKYLPIIESAMNPHAVSRVGATGLWQFMFSTGRGYGLKMDNFVDERKDPVQASYAAAAYFRDAYAELGDWLLAIAAYNCGKGNVQKAINKANSRDFWQIRQYLPLETRNYVPAFIAAVYIMNCPAFHNIKIQKSMMAARTDTIQVNRFVSLDSLATALNMDQEALCGLNPSYKKRIVNGTLEAPKRIIMPAVSLADYAVIYEVLNNGTVNGSMEVVLAANDDRRLKRKVSASVPERSIAYHKVAPGQNLTAIANKYKVEVQDLKVWNHLKSNSIVPGQKLIVSKQATPGKSSAHNPKYLSYQGQGSRQQGSGKL